MNRLFAPWRIEWVEREEDDFDGCIFCVLPERDDDEENLVVARSTHSYVMLNNYPYNPGHVMVVPYQHSGRYDGFDDEVLLDHARLKARTFRAMEEAFDPDGYNTGLNLGEGSGGSIKDHLHTHIVPRWIGDTNYLPVTADTKVIVEAVEESYGKLRQGFLGLADAEIDGDGAVEFLD